MNINRIYYTLKPLIPWSLRIAMRRKFMQRKRRLCRQTWPIHEAAGKQPPAWPGWPEGKRFALVLTHDVESILGVQRHQKLMELERRLGFRSSFNFVPAGSYDVSRQMRDDLVAGGFELGIHDLRHDGKLYSSKSAFLQQAESINRYLKEWNAPGFRSAFMFHNLEWIKNLDVLYDASTFDTDPFEPQPDGVETIFPFWVPRNDGSGYVELPYTLAQDFSLFVILQEESIDVWKRKLDWVAKRGGMALLNTHPDYMSFDGGAQPPGEYPARFYQEFLEYVKSRYEGEYWHALPATVARFVVDQVRATPKTGAVVTEQEAGRLPQPRKVWIDLDNTPHVPFFEPIIKRLEQKGYSVQLTGRDAFQVCDLAKLKGMKILRIGRHSGKNRIAKFFGLYYRALQLAPHVLDNKPTLALSHGSRSQIFLCNILRIPTILIADYEHAKRLPLATPTWILIPEVIPGKSVHVAEDRILTYPGIKEDVYVPGFQPDPSLLEKYELNDTNIIVTVRPPATEAHYHNPESDTLFLRVMAKLHSARGVQVVLLPRNKKQAIDLAREHPEWFLDGKVMVPEEAVDGLNLIYHSDLVISGGGTMNREAAALNVPVYSIFRGKIGAVDRYLNECGKLVLLESVEDVDQKIELERRRRHEVKDDENPRLTLDSILDQIDHIYDFYEPGRG